MAKNGLKMVEFFQGGSHMMKSNILNIFCFSTFSSTNFTNPVFWPNLKKIALKTRSRKYPKEKKSRGFDGDVLEGVILLEVESV